MHPKPRKAAGPGIRTAGKCNLLKKLKPRYFKRANIALVFSPGTPSQAGNTPPKAPVQTRFTLSVMISSGGGSARRHEPRALRSTNAPSSRARSKGERGFSKRRDTFNAPGLLPDFARGFGCAPRFCASFFCAPSFGTEGLAVACGVARSSLPEEG